MFSDILDFAIMVNPTKPLLRLRDDPEYLAATLAEGRRGLKAADRLARAAGLRRVGFLLTRRARGQKLLVTNAQIFRLCHLQRQ